MNEDKITKLVIGLIDNDITKIYDIINRSNLPSSYFKELTDVIISMTDKVKMLITEDE